MTYKVKSPFKKVSYSSGYLDESWQLYPYKYCPLDYHEWILNKK